MARPTRLRVIAASCSSSTSIELEDGAITQAVGGRWHLQQRIDEEHIGMVIGLDIDGTINRHPKFFAFLSQMLLAAGHEVIVITFREDRKSASDDLTAWGIHYSTLVTWSFQDNRDEDMYSWKGRICADRKVEILFDDDPQVLCQLGPKVLGLMVVDHESHDLTLLDDTDTPGAACQWQIIVATGRSGDRHLFPLSADRRPDAVTIARAPLAEPMGITTRGTTPQLIPTLRSI